MESCYTLEGIVKTYCWPFQLKANCSEDLINRERREKEKQIARATAAYQVPGDMLICLNNETTSGKTAMTGAYNNPLSFSKIHQSSEQAKEAS